MKKFLLSCFVAMGIGANAQITLGGTTTTQGQPFPVESFYGFSYTQQVFLKSEIKADTAGNITGLKFYLPTAAALTNSSSWVVYLGNTAKTTFATATDWIPTSALTQVFSGTVTNTAGVVEVTLATPFAYNNTDNLVVAVDENAAGYNASADRFYSYTGVTNSSIYFRSDTVNPDPAAITQTGTLSGAKSKVTFLGLSSSAPGCASVSAPAANATGVSLTPTINWTAAANAIGYKLSVGTTPGGTNVLNAVDLGNVLTYTFTTPLSSSTKYYYTVNAYTATLTSTGCAERSFTTVCGAVALPYTQNFDGVTAPALPSCTTVQNAGSGNNWAISNLTTPSVGFSGNVLRYIYNSLNAANAWFYTPGLTMTGGTTYALKFKSGGNNPGYTEKLKIAYGTSATSASMTNVIVNYPVVEQGTSSMKTVYFTPTADGTYYIGFNAYSAADQDNLFVDDISINVAPTAVPACAISSSPANAASNVNVRTTFTWADVADAGSYKLYLGTTSGGTDVLNGVVTTSGTTLANNPPLLANTTYYLKIVASNNIGDATGCTETTFTTGANPYAPYCGPFTSSAPTEMAPITSFTLNGVTNASDASATTIGSFAANESFTGTSVEVKNNLTTIPFSVTGIGIANNGWGASVFVDWNNDGDFLDAGESYFNTTATMLSSTTVTGGKVTLTGNLAIPAGAALGQKRLRIKYNFTSTPINSPLANACTDLTNGQVEDYTIDYKSFLAVSDVNKSSLSVYPNPFTDVLKISDVKDVKSISVNDMSGRQVKSLAPSAELNLSNLKAGLYIVNLQMEDGSVKTFKAIKK